MTSLTAALVIGDIIALLVFSAWGRAAHGMQLEAASVLATGLPFAITWFIIAALLGGYKPEVVSSPGAAAKRAALINIIAAPLAVVLRALVLQRPIAWTFLVVATTTSLIVMTVWRTVFAFTRRRAGA